MKPDDPRDEILARRARERLAIRTPRLPRAELDALVAGFLARRDEFLGLARRFGSPLYVLEESVLLERARRLTGAFRAAYPDVGVFYAVKTNAHPAVARCLVLAGLGLDVSSGLELRAALDAGAREIVFSGPAKTDSELALALAHHGLVTVLLDSVGELRALNALARAAGVRARAGVRVSVPGAGLWRKFGIPLEALPAFAAEAGSCPGVRWCGLQFHTSWNLEPSAQVAMIRRLGPVVAGLPEATLAALEFLDVGGGFWPEQGEWLQAAATPEGRLRALLEDGALPTADEALAHYRAPARPIADFAGAIAGAVRECFPPRARLRLCLEPGRWLVNDALHLLLTVRDAKEGALAITDGGTNAIGWERFESDYAPVLNLTRPSAEERPFLVLGSLCTPHDVWGYAVFGAELQPGDRLLIPHQGAYTYSLRQTFIKPLPDTVVIGADATVSLARPLTGRPGSGYHTRP